MGLQAVTWFEIEKYPSALNSLLLLFDDIYVPNTLWLETGSKFEDVYFKISLTQNEIYDVVITPVFLGGDPVQSSIPFIEVYGALPMERKEGQGRFVPFFEVLHNVNEYPPSISNIIKIIFDKINKVSPFQQYNKFTYDYAPLISRA